MCNFLPEQRNTYQAVIASDGKTAYVLFLYKDVQWTSPDGSLQANSDRNTEGGLGAGPEFLPVIGLGDGKGEQQLLFSKARSQWKDEDYLMLAKKAGNTGRRGMTVIQASKSSTLVLQNFTG